MAEVPVPIVVLNQGLPASGTILSHNREQQRNALSKPLCSQFNSLALIVGPSEKVQKNWCLWTVKNMTVDTLNHKSKQFSITVDEVKPSCLLKVPKMKLKHKYFGQIHKGKEKTQCWKKSNTIKKKEANTKQGSSMLWVMAQAGASKKPPEADTDRQSSNNVHLAT